MCTRFGAKLNQKMRQNMLWGTDQYGVSFVWVSVREGGVDGQADAVPHDGQQDEELKRLPLHQGDTVLPVHSINQ